MWRADLADDSGEDLLELLTPEEHARARRLAREQDGHLWARSRGVLRALLERYLERDGRSFRFAAGAHGKPALLPQQSQPDVSLSFNLSHSGPVALYAFARTLAVGVDIELGRPTLDPVALAARMLGANEAARLRALDPASREREFLLAWVKHEAVLKCLGTGIGGERVTAQAQSPWVADLDVGPAAAIAVEARPRELRCWSWR